MTLGPGTSASRTRRKCASVAQAARSLGLEEVPNPWLEEADFKAAPHAPGHTVHPQSLVASAPFSWTRGPLTPGWQVIAAPLLGTPWAAGGRVPPSPQPGDPAAPPEGGAASVVFQLQSPREGAWLWLDVP